MREAAVSRARFGDAAPPAVFPPILGALGLGIAWRRAAGVLGVPGMIAELMLGALTLLFLCCLAAYLLKVSRRPGVVPEDLRALPGRAGLSAGVLSIYVTAAALAPMAPAPATVILIAGFVLHAVLAGLLVRLFLWGPQDARVITPVWHLHFVGFIVGAVACAALGFDGLAAVILFLTAAIAAAIWSVSLYQLRHREIAPPLRPLLAIHLAPASLLGTVAVLTGYPGIAIGFAVLATLIFAALLWRLRWIIAAGFSPLWSAFTFPLAAFASFLLALAAAGQGDLYRVAGGGVLLAATLVIPPILFRVMAAWANGQLADRTSAARVQRGAAGPSRAAAGDTAARDGGRGIRTEGDRPPGRNAAAPPRR